jgi:DNA-directed RNA polymerase specialized sigma24 family protein
VPKRGDIEDPINELRKSMKALLLVQIAGWKQREQVQLLDRAGFVQSEIAQIIGSTSNAVSVRLAELRRANRTTEKRRDA